MNLQTMVHPHSPLQAVNLSLSIVLLQNHFLGLGGCDRRALLSVYGFLFLPSQAVRHGNT